MTLRSAHGNARRLGRTVVVETLPVDELPAGFPDPNAAPQPARDALGRYQAGHPATVEAARTAGRARRARTALAHSLGVTSDDPEWSRYLRQAEAFRRAQVRILASTVGGGQCGPAPAALVANAALALAASRYRYARGEHLEGARLAAEVRQHLLGAHELAAREAAARPKAHASPILAAIEAAAARSARQDAFSAAQAADPATGGENASNGNVGGKGAT